MAKIQSAARAVKLVKTYGTGDTAVEALKSISIKFRKQQFTAIMGPSGSGKSTLMHCMAGLDRVTRGATFIGNTDLSQLNDRQMTALRRDRLGFIFQSFNLVPTLTAAENITLPMNIAGKRVDKKWYREVTTRLGLAERLKHRPAELSGGQQQRVACARALVARPEIIFGDEPTGNLDSNSSAEVLDILRTAVDVYDQTVVIVTHGRIICGSSGVFGGWQNCEGIIVAHGGTDSLGDGPTGNQGVTHGASWYAERSTT